MTGTFDTEASGILSRIEGKIDDILKTLYEEEARIAAAIAEIENNKGEIE